MSLFVFVIAFMGAGLLFPSYFLQVRGESTLHAGLLMAPQGIGAMLTMPIAGMLADKIPVGRTVPFAMALIAAGFFTFTQVGTDTSYVLLLRLAVRDGPGHGRHDDADHDLGAADPAASHEVARGSTLVNILQQIGGSIGAATMSVILTSRLNELAPRSPARSTRAPASRSPRPAAAIASQQRRCSVPRSPAVIQRGLEFAARLRSPRRSGSASRWCCDVHPDRVPAQEARGIAAARRGRRRARGGARHDPLNSHWTGAPMWITLDP